MKCAHEECKREATSKLDGYPWLCTRHFKELIKKLRVDRKLRKRVIYSPIGD